MFISVHENVIPKHILLFQWLTPYQAHYSVTKRGEFGSVWHVRRVIVVVVIKT